MKKSKKIDLGDFQTPIPLTDRICRYISSKEFKPQILIEPTCGAGNFVFSAIKYFPSLKLVYCVELQPKYKDIFFHKLEKLRKDLSLEIEFHVDNIFTHQFSERLKAPLQNPNEHILIIGNPPWVTNSEIARLGGDNLPSKSNLKKLKGIDALTGKSNFDIAEYIIIHLLKRFGSFRGKIAMLCKLSTAVNLLKYLSVLNLNISNIQFLTIDSKQEFDINVKSGLFLADLGKKGIPVCEVRDLYTDKKINRFGWINSKFVANFELYEKYKFLEGNFPFEWRQGVKHDASKVLILKRTDRGLVNGYGERVEVETEFLYPFLKGSQIRKPKVNATDYFIIITQKYPNDDTSSLVKCPKLWNYLMSHADLLDKRKSKVFKRRFSIFGVGDYAFKPYKVAIAGFYKEPLFTLVSPINGKPVFLDDTTYYISFDSRKEAEEVWKLLNSSEVKNFLKAISFIDSKRPFTKEILKRIDLSQLNLKYKTNMQLCLL